MRLPQSIIVFWLFAGVTSTVCAFVPRSAATVRPSFASSLLHYKEGSEAETTNPIATAPSSSSSSVPAAPPTLSSVFTPWPTARVTAHGDYGTELYLEDLIGGPLYALQKTELPHLPLCDILETLERLKPTVLPLAKNEQERQDFLQAVERFAQQAKPLQELLQERQQQATESHTSWLQSLWQPLIYLQYRDPLPQYVTYYLLVPDDDKLPVTPHAGVQRAAAILYALAESRQVIASGQMAPDMAGESPLCSVGFKYLFHASRIPMQSQDAYHLYDPARYRHAIVATQGQFYAVQIVNDDENPLPLPVLEARLQYCRELAKQQQKEWPQMGWATSLHRDTWGALRQEWVQNEKLATALERLESGAFLLALDEEVSFKNRKTVFCSCRCNENRSLTVLLFLHRLPKL